MKHYWVKNGAIGFFDRNLCQEQIMESSSFLLQFYLIQSAGGRKNKEKINKNGIWSVNSKENIYINNHKYKKVLRSPELFPSHFCKYALKHHKLFSTWTSPKPCSLVSQSINLSSWSIPFSFLDVLLYSFSRSGMINGTLSMYLEIIWKQISVAKKKNTSNCLYFKPSRIKICPPSLQQFLQE